MGQPKAINKIERRKSERVTGMLDIEYYFLQDNIDALSKVTYGYRRIRKKTVIIDISGSEIALVNYGKIEIGKLVKYLYHLLCFRHGLVKIF